MLIQVENQVFDIEQIKEKAPVGSNLSDDTNFVLNFIHSWTNGTEQFSFQSSGSTGKPKKIVLSREVLAYSAEQTLRELGLEGQSNLRFLLCINPRFIGGTMVIVRALLSRADLIVIPPESDFSGLKSPIHYASMVPLQVQKVLVNTPSLFEDIQQVLIGGAPISKELESQLKDVKAKFYHTYGMTETASHVAIRPIAQSEYRAVGDARFKIEDGNLSITGTVTDGKWLHTNDQVILEDNQTFLWKGRSDFLINTGGIKVDPEKVESLLAPQFSKPHAITSKRDERLGNMVILVTEETQKNLDLSELARYERPKELLWNTKVPLTASGKIDRKKLMKLVAHG